MRLSRSLASATVAVSLVLPLSYEAIPHARVEPPRPLAMDAVAPRAASPEPFGADCRVRVTGSRVTAYCHNPYPRADRVSLHIECARWWDVDSDGASVTAGPAQTVRLTGRCWKEVRTVWISHREQRHFGQTG